jgi:hypothetical protein
LNQLWAEKARAFKVGLFRSILPKAQAFLISTGYLEHLTKARAFHNSRFYAARDFKNDKKLRTQVYFGANAQLVYGE